MDNPLYRLADAWVARKVAAGGRHASATRDLRPSVLVSGASRGIGLALAHRFAAAGQEVVLVARDGAALTVAAENVAAASRAKVHALAADITDAGFPSRLDGELERRGLFLDVLVNNAGIGLSGRFDAQDPDAIQGLIALNITAATRLMRHALPPMLARGRGGVLNIASLGGLVPGPHQAAYYASKAYVIALSDAVGCEISGSGVRVAVVAPGPVATGFHAAMDAEGARYRRLIPALTPEAVAASAYRGYRLGRRVIVPGFIGLPLGYLTRALPRPVSVPLVGWLLDPGGGRRESSKP